MEENVLARLHTENEALTVAGRLTPSTLAVDTERKDLQVFWLSEKKARTE